MPSQHNNMNTGRCCRAPKRIGGIYALFILLGSSAIRANVGAALMLPSQKNQYRYLSNYNRLEYSPPSSSQPLLLLSRTLFQGSTTLLNAKPKRGSVVESYQTVSVNCVACKNRLFRYKKKNGTKSNLIKCFVERIVYDDPEGVLEQQLDNFTELSDDTDHEWACPNCKTKFGRSSLIRGLPAIKLVGGKTRMTKK